MQGWKDAGLQGEGAAGFDRLLCSARIFSFTSRRGGLGVTRQPGGVGGLQRWGQAGDIQAPAGLQPCCWFWQRRRDPCLHRADPLAKSSSRALLPPLLLPLRPSEKGLRGAVSPSAPPQRPPWTATPPCSGAKAPLAHPKGPSSRTRSPWPLPAHPLPTLAGKTPQGTPCSAPRGWGCPSCPQPSQAAAQTHHCLSQTNPGNVLLPSSPAAGCAFGGIDLPVWGNFRRYLNTGWKNTAKLAGYGRDTSPTRNTGC